MYRICSRKYDRRWLGNAPDTYKKLWGRCNAGRYVCAFAIHKKSCTIFLLIVILFALFFSQGDLLILTECLILFMFPLYLLYRNISKIGKCEEGRRLVLLYLEKVLHANVEISVEEE